MERQFDAASPELMDRPQPVNEDLRGALRDLAWLNRHLGANRVVWSRVRHLFHRGSPLRGLDLATGGADIPRFLADAARKGGCPLEIDAVDFHPATLELARGFSTDYPEITFHQGDARNWSGERPYNLILCTLALHHFSETDAIAVLRNLAILAAGQAQIVLLDLERSRLNAFLIWLLTGTLIRTPMTVQDARTSIRAAFTAAELTRLATAAGWRNFTVRRIFPARLILEAPSSPSAPSP